MPIPLQPYDSLLACPRCGFTWEFLNLGSGLNYRCGGCEWFFGLATPVVAAPGVPGSTVAVTNTTGTIVIATISGGTLTFVFVNGAQVGTTAGAYALPAGGTISITYSVAPTWTWTLPQTSGSVVAGAVALPIAAGGASFTAGMQLLVDTGSNLEAVVVGSGATATSIPVPAGLTRAHGSAVAFGQPKLTSSFGTAQSVPAASPWPTAMPATF